MSVIRWLRAHWKALLTALTTLTGVLSDPHSLNLLPPAWSRSIAITGLVLQAISQAITKASSLPTEPDAR